MMADLLAANRENFESLLVPGLVVLQAEILEYTAKTNVDCREGEVVET